MTGPESIEPPFYYDPPEETEGESLSAEERADIANDLANDN